MKERGRRLPLVFIITVIYVDYKERESRKEVERRIYKINDMKQNHSNHKLPNSAIPSPRRGLANLASGPPHHDPACGYFPGLSNCIKKCT